MNKNIILGLVILAVAVGAYFLFTKEKVIAPVTNETPTKTAGSVYIGMTVSQAEEFAQVQGELFRVVEIDGVMQPTTRDFQEGRINAVVQSGVVTSYTVESMSPSDKESEQVKVGVNDMILGMTVAEAEMYAKANGVDFRTGTVDGVGMPVTMDFRPGRITAEIKNGVVVGYSVE
jgi:uncharacterized OB-fold protein